MYIIITTKGEKTFISTDGDYYLLGSKNNTTPWYNSDLVSINTLLMIKWWRSKWLLLCIYVWIWTSLKWNSFLNLPGRWYKGLINNSSWQRNSLLSQGYDENPVRKPYFG